MNVDETIVFEWKIQYSRWFSKSHHFKILCIVKDILIDSFLNMC